MFPRRYGVCTLWFAWLGFLLVVVLLLALDLGVFNRRPHVVSAAEALGWTAAWVVVAALFGGAVWWIYEHSIAGLSPTAGDLDGRDAVLMYASAWMLEKSLSIDNIFVIAMIFAHFQVPSELQHRVLYWGVLGALVMRAVMIVLGLAIFDAIDWLVYVFGGFLILSAIRMFLTRDDHPDPGNSLPVRLIRRVMPVTGFDGQKFFTRVDGGVAATQLFLALVVVEGADLVFAVDSIPAAFAVTTDPFLIFTSNAFAILGLRSLYFALAAMMDRFRYLKLSLVAVLLFVGVKMILAHHHPIPPLVSLAIIGSVLGAGVVASLLLGGKDPVRVRKGAGLSR